MKYALLQASPEEIKKKQENANRAMRELLDEEEKEAGAAFSQTRVLDQLRHIPIKNKELLHLISPPRQVRHVCCPLNLFLNAPSVRSPRSTPATFQCCAAKGHQQQQYSHNYDLLIATAVAMGEAVAREMATETKWGAGGCNRVWTSLVERRDKRCCLFLGRHLGQPQLHMLKLSALICSNVRKKIHHLYPSATAHPAFCTNLFKCKKKIPPFVSIVLSIFWCRGPRR